MRLRAGCALAASAVLTASVAGVMVQPVDAPTRTSPSPRDSADYWRVAQPLPLTPLPSSDVRPAARAAGSPARLEDVAVTSPAVHALEREAQQALEHMIRSPSVLHGFDGSTGLPTRAPLPVLSTVETMELIQRTWFFLTACEARRELEAEAAERIADAGAGERARPLPSFPLSHTALLARMRQVRIEGAPRGSAAGGSAGERAAIARMRQVRMELEGAPLGSAAGGGASTAAALGPHDASVAPDIAQPRARACAALQRWGPYRREPGRDAASTDCPSDCTSKDCAEMRAMLSESMSDVEFRLRESVGRAAYNRLFAHHQGLIYAEVQKIIPNWRAASVLEKADFLQEGAQGLLRALRLFDVGRGLAFSTYAVWHIRAYVLRAVRDKGRLVRLPQALQSDMGLIRKARYRFAVENQGGSPLVSELAETLSWSEERVVGALTGLANQACISLDAELGPAGKGFGNDGSYATLGETLAGSAAGPGAMGRAVGRAEGRTDGSDGAARIEGEGFASTLRDVQGGRDPWRAKMARLKYGLEDGREWTYAQLAERFHLSVDKTRGIVRAEVAYLRKEKARLLAHFMHE